MMNRILDEEAGFGSGYVPSRLYPLLLGRTCRREKIMLKPALPAHIAVKKPGWKPMMKSVAGSRFGQQNVSRRGEAMLRSGEIYPDVCFRKTASLNPEETSSTLGILI